LTSLGWAESVALGVVVLVTLWMVLRRQRARELPQLWVLAVWVLGALLVLSSSGNLGTGFGLPLLAVTIVVCAAVLFTTVEFGRLVLPVTLVVLLLAGGASLATSSTNSWWPGPNYRAAVFSSGGSTRTNVDELTAQVAKSLGPGRAIDIFNSPILNSNGLLWDLPPSTQLTFVEEGPDSTRQLILELPHVNSLVAGVSPVSFDFFVDHSSVESAALRDGLRPAREWNVSKTVRVVLMNRGTKVQRWALAPPKVVIGDPRAGSELTKNQYLLAVAQDVIGDQQKVTFLIAGASLSHPLEIPTFPLGGDEYLGGLGINQLTPGKYSIRGEAEDGYGIRGYSRAITVYVK